MTQPEPPREPLQPELVDGPDQPGAPPTGAGSPEAPSPAGQMGQMGQMVVPEGEQVTQPTKLIRIASMVRSMLDEVRRAPLDDEGRAALRDIHLKSMAELEDVISPELRDELNEVAIPLSSGTPSESQLRLAQAQLVGWLEGLFHGIQATLFTQQAQAQQQLEEMRRRMLQAGPRPPGSGDGRPGSGYL